MRKEIKSQIERCTTKKQVLLILKKEGINILKQDETKTGFYVDEVTRIYKPYHQKTFKVQTFQKVLLQATSTPTFFANKSYF